MPKISEFFGIIIMMFYNDHEPPHFHAKYGEYRAIFSTDSFEILDGAFPPRATRLVREWAALHQEELFQEWQLAREHRPLFWIEPLE
jgi:hypothetical protein